MSSECKQLLGREYRVVEPGPQGRISSRFQPKPKARFLFTDIKHANGTNIRFKSLDRAANYIRAHGLERSGDA